MLSLILSLEEGSGINSILLAQSMPQHMKVCISLNLFAGLNCSWPVSLFSKLLLETCTHVQVELNVTDEPRQGTGVDMFFSEEVKYPCFT